MIDAGQRHAVLMGAPNFFSVRGGANPHTRTLWGFRKHVRRDLAVEQWHTFARQLSNAGVIVIVVPPDPRWPGLVYPANAGVLLPLEPPLPWKTKRFVLSNLIRTRAGEKAIYREVLSRIGLPLVEVKSRFEGEADFFPVGDDLMLFTYGAIERQRFVPRWGIPPYERRYGFRSERAAIGELAALVPDRDVLPLELRLEAFYHGDTCLAAFGENRRFVLAYLEALTPDSQQRLRERLGNRLVPLSEADALLYAANCFRLSSEGRELLFLPQGVSSALQREIRERAAEPLTVDVSEFWKKGGGSVKCMIGDLGVLDEPANEEIARWRHHYRYRSPR